MKKCWASEDSECEGKMSREHLISQSTFKGIPEFENLKMRCFGLPWNENGYTDINYKALSSKVLCVKHNSMLSELDSEAGRIAEIFRSIERCLEKAKNATRHEDSQFNFSGTLLERWLLKTYINFHSLYFPNELPPKELIEIVFGKRHFPEGVGLATIGRKLIGLNEFGQDMKYVQIVNRADNLVEYVLFQYFGINYLLPLTDQPMPKHMMELQHNRINYSPIDELVKNIQGASIHCHTEGINFEFGNYIKANIKINWK